MSSLLEQIQDLAQAPTQSPMPWVRKVAERYGWTTESNGRVLWEFSRGHEQIKARMHHPARIRVAYYHTIYVIPGINELWALPLDDQLWFPRPSRIQGQMEQLVFWFLREPNHAWVDAWTPVAS
jgi:hypothetical protein